MRASSESGGSGVIAISPSIINMLNLHIGENVSLELDSSNAIVIKPLQRKHPWLHPLPTVATLRGFAALPLSW